MPFAAFFVGGVLSSALSVQSCRALDPAVGPFRGTCERDTEYDLTVAIPPGAPDPRCGPDGGTADNACEQCANAHCCTERFVCLDDLACNCANQTLEKCTDADESGDGSASAKCWNTFGANDPKSVVFFACAKKSCASECRIGS